LTKYPKRKLRQPWTNEHRKLLDSEEAHPPLPCVKRVAHHSNSPQRVRIAQEKSRSAHVPYPTSTKNFRTLPRIPTLYDKWMTTTVQTQQSHFRSTTISHPLRGILLKWIPQLPKIAPIYICPYSVAHDCIHSIVHYSYRKIITINKTVPPNQHRQTEQ
jgi:hypothetical protein